MRIGDLMQTEIQTIPVDARVSDAATTLADARVSALPVVDERGALVGVISTTDILGLEEDGEGERARETMLDDTRVRDVMTPRPLIISPDDDLREAARRMLDADVHRLIVVQDERMVGIISVTDIMRAVAAGQLVSLGQANPQSR